jgi:glyoxylase-like metal-dependent hydrolase (beta-lactamase superfamily II)
MNVAGLELGPFAARCVLLSCAATGEALVVDPGFEPEAVIAAVRTHSLHPTALVLTHAHIDHAWGIAALKAAFPQASVLLHEDDLPLYGNLAGQSQLFGLPSPGLVPHDGLLHDGEALAFGRERVLVRHCPGHSPGHVVLVRDDPSAPLAVVGDVLFAGSIGRTDLWGGSLPQLLRSIREVLYRLPDATRVIPGHGPETTIGAEKNDNPFATPSEPAAPGKNPEAPAGVE